MIYITNDTRSGQCIREKKQLGSTDYEALFGRRSGFFALDLAIRLNGRGKPAWSAWRCSLARFALHWRYEHEFPSIQVSGPQTKIGLQAAVYQGSLDLGPDSLRHACQRRNADDTGRNC